MDKELANVHYPNFLVNKPTKKGQKLVCLSELSVLLSTSLALCLFHNLVCHLKQKQGQLLLHYMRDKYLVFHV